MLEQAKSLRGNGCVCVKVAEVAGSEVYIEQSSGRMAEMSQ